MDIRSIQGTDDRWDDLVWESPGGTIFHTLKFLSYHPETRFDFLNLAFWQGKRMVGVMPGGRVGTTEGDIFKSPVGASWGGFVFSAEGDLRTVADVIDHFAIYIRDLGMTGIEVVMPPMCYSRSTSQALAFLLTSCGYNLALREATAVVPLKQIRENGFNPTIRRNVRKASGAGIKIRQGGNLWAFYDVLVKNLAAKGVTPTHSVEELERLFGIFPDRMILFEAALEGLVVGGCLLILCKATSALAFYICDDPERRQLRIAESVLHACIEWLIESGFEHLDLGTVSVGGRLNWGLLRFKSKFSARVDFREHYSLRFHGAS